MDSLFPEYLVFISEQEKLQEVEVEVILQEKRTRLQVVKCPVVGAENRPIIKNQTLILIHQ